MKEQTWTLIEEHFRNRPNSIAEPVSDEELSASIAELGFSHVSTDYRQFILRYGAAEVGPYTIYGIRKTPGMGPYEGTFVEMTNQYRQDKWPEIDDWLIISTDLGGNPIGLSEDGSIWVSDPDCEVIPLLIASNFEEFLLKHCLKIDD